MSLNINDICVWLIFANSRLALSEGRAKCVGRLIYVAVKWPPFSASRPSAAPLGLALPLQVRRPASPHPPLSPRYKDLHPSLFSHFLHLSSISPCRSFAPSRMIRAYANPFSCLAGLWRLSPIVMLWSLRETFCWPFPLGPLCCTSHLRHFLIYSLSPTAGASDKSESSYSLPRILSPAL